MDLQLEGLRRSLDPSAGLAVQPLRICKDDGIVCVGDDGAGATPSALLGTSVVALYQSELSPRAAAIGPGS